MKLIITLILAFLSLLFSIPSMSQCIHGKGDVVSETINVEKFNKIRIECSADVVFKKGNTQLVEVKGQSNIIEQLTTKVVDSQWEIDFDKSVCMKKEFVIYVTLPSLEGIKINGSGDVTSESTFNEEDFSVYINGSGDVEFSVEADAIDININGSGDVILDGKANNLDVEINGSGSVSTYDLSAENCEVDVNGSGDSQISVSSSLKVHINGSGDVNYMGNPESLDIRESGSGDVNRR